MNACYVISNMLIVIMNTDKMSQEMNFVAVHTIKGNKTKEINFALLGTFLSQETSLSLNNISASTKVTLS